MAAAGIPGRDDSPTEVDRRRLRKRPVRAADRRREQVRDVRCRVAVLRAVAGIRPQLRDDPFPVRLERTGDVVVGVDRRGVEGDVAEGVVEMNVRVDDVPDRPVTEDVRRVAQDLLALQRGGARVDDEGCVRPDDEPDVDVPLPVPRDIDPVGDLDEHTTGP